MPKTPKNPKEAELKKRVAKLPEKPGVYRWMDGRGKVLYVGKAKNLRNRVRSYLQKDAAHGPWKQSLMQAVRDLDVTVASSELQALVLETNLIKQHKPKYNVLMKDDKHYLYVRISVQDPFPRIDMVRKPLDDGAKYFGPYTRGFEMKETLTMLRKIFPYRNCKMEIEPSSPIPNPPLAGEGLGVGARIPVVIKHRDRPTPCLDYHIKQCAAPCIGCVASEEYRRDAIDPVMEYLKGNTEGAAQLLEDKMRDAARERKFERAAKLRDALKLLTSLEEKHIVSDTSGEDADIWGVALASGRAHIVLLKERGGKVIAEESMALSGQAETRVDILAQVLPQFYITAPDIPPLVILGEELPESALLSAMLSRERGTKVSIATPERGKKHKLLDLAEENALEKVKQFETKWEAAARNIEEALQELRTTLGLPVIPKRIEGYDISHLGGMETVGSMAVFVEGKPKNEHYRSFTIRSLPAGEVDDYRSLQEVLKRRLLHLKGSVREEILEWRKTGIVIRAAQKADRSGIQKLVEANPENLSSTDLDQGKFFVAVRKEKVIACCRIFEHETGLPELRSVCVAKQERGGKLGQSVIRALLATRKKGKVYIVIDPKLEEYYAEIGFRHVLQMPPILEKKVATILTDNPALAPPAVMMFETAKNKPDTSLLIRPDLLLIDGGKGQLGAVTEVMRELNVTIPVIGLAKEHEEVFVPGMTTAIAFAKDSAARFLLMRIRDEAHRFANRHREKRKSKVFTASSLDDLPGIGPETRQKLLQKFGSREGIREATDEEILMILSEHQLETLRAGI